MTKTIKRPPFASTVRLVAVLGLAAATLTGGLVTSAFAQNGDGQRGEQWRRGHHYGQYYRHPGHYYAPPPYVYQPHGYYQQPGASLNFNFPFY